MFEIGGELNIFGSGKFGGLRNIYRIILNLWESMILGPLEVTSIFIVRVRVRILKRVKINLIFITPIQI